MAPDLPAGDAVEAGVRLARVMRLPAGDAVPDEAFGTGPAPMRDFLSVPRVVDGDTIDSRVTGTRRAGIRLVAIFSVPDHPWNR